MVDNIEDFIYLCTMIGIDMLPEEKMNLHKIEAIIKLKKEIKEVRAIMEELSEPILMDWSLLPILYQEYKGLFSKRDITHPIYHRQKFLFVILYLYCPSALAGERMPMGFRKELASLFGLNACSTISDNCAGLTIMYERYLDFRKDTQLFFERVLSFRNISES